jgi:hypothetical protein
MIVTTAEVKTLLSITVSTKDETIKALLPSIEQFLLDWTKNQFKQTKVYRESTAVSFDAATLTITDGEAQFLVNKLNSGLKIVVEGSLFNDGHYEIDTSTESTLTLVAGSELIAEDTGEHVKITAVFYPRSLKLVVAQMVAYAMQKANKEGIQSESLGDYSVTFTSADAYPKSILKMLNPYRKVGW